MQTTRIDAAGELQRAADLLFKNWMLALPTAVGSLVIAALGLLLVGSVVAAGLVGALAAGRAGAGIAGILTALPLFAVFFISAALIMMIAQAVVVRAAEDVWEGRPVDLGGSLAAALQRLVPIVGAFLLVLAILIVPIALTIVVIGFPLILVVAYLLMYVVPAVVIGNESATDAIRTSFNLAKSNVGPSIIAFIGIIVALALGGIIDGMVRHWGVLHLIVSFAVGGLTSAYAALIASRFYVLLRPTQQLPLQ